MILKYFCISEVDLINSINIDRDSPILSNLHKVITK